MKGSIKISDHLMEICSVYEYILDQIYENLEMCYDLSSLDYLPNYSE